MCDVYLIHRLNDKIDLCFTCAVKEIVNNSTAKIVISSTSYEYTKCDKCDEFIIDKAII